ncbi:lymphocyte-specific protein 1 isoform X3 [Neofelis nebulosa]|uniref:lymphocyte-specific protein 1 isoform X3 n=1 Tax=Neofelis nebulosa TaxID=61452 RepID=UPI002729E366|nr:lymphocyte-specific protein 1 isoform X3 [Neofelis nebulosa]
MTAIWALTGQSRARGPRGVRKTGVRPGRGMGTGRQRPQPVPATSRMSWNVPKPSLVSAPSPVPGGPSPARERLASLEGRPAPGGAGAGTGGSRLSGARKMRRRPPASVAAGRGTGASAQDKDGGQSPEPPERESLLSLKPSEAPELDEDEGFSDWSQKPEPQRQPWEAGGGSNSGEPPRSESPEGQQEENRPHQHACRSQGGDEQSPARVSLEELHLSPSSELQEGPGTEETEPKSPEGTVQGSLGPAEAEEADEQHQKRQQPRTPSPLVLEGATEQGSPPLSPSTKLIDRTESLNRSIRKSVKKSQPALPISKIDERLEQYTQAIETAGRTPKLTRQPSIELPSMAVASTKSRWETGEVQAQSTARTPSCKDIVAGDMSKKSLWEQKGGSKTSSTIKQSTPSGKRYKFVATGHGKYEKVLVDEGSVP